MCLRGQDRESTGQLFSVNVLEWIRTSNFVIEDNNQKVVKSSSRGISATGVSPDCDDSQASPANTPTSDYTPTEFLIGADNDSLIPRTVQICQVYLDGQETWCRLLKEAGSLSRGYLPPTFTNTLIMLKDVPPLPEDMPKTRYLRGQAVWDIPALSSLIKSEATGRESDWNLSHTCSPPIVFDTIIEQPMRCRVSYMRPSSIQRNARGYGLLLLAWSYILSVKLIELQKRQVRYTESFRQPVSAADMEAKPREILVYLGSRASPRLVRWLAALLAPALGWTVRGPLPPWAVYLDADVTIVADQSITSDFEARPPSSSEATVLLAEFCELFGLAKPVDGSVSNPVSPVTAAFLAALALPFSHASGFEPRLPHFSFRVNEHEHYPPFDVGPLRQHAVSIRYYMTLSLSGHLLGSVIWSIFWQPEIECNLVSPWFASILTVLRPAIESRDMDTLVRLFALRRPRVAPWWLGIFLLGDDTIFERIVRFLETHEEREGYASTSTANIVAAAWTGARQSFLDTTPLRTYPHDCGLVSRADILRHRNNLRLGTEYHITPWLPFGQIPIRDVEQELWPFLERKCPRKYRQWVWCKQGKNTYREEIQKGFRRDIGLFMDDVPERLELARSNIQPGRVPEVKITPSKETTLRMLTQCVEDVSGDVHIENAGMPGIQDHPWLRGWRGLE